MPATFEEAPREIGLVRATGVGIGAIVGGGILVLAGVAFSRTGPGSIVAFALNGIIAYLTAFSVAEVAAAFPESGGAYHFARKFFSVRAAFVAGWIIWFAYIVAGVLYGLGFASYAIEMISGLLRAADLSVPSWIMGRGFIVFLACAATGSYTLRLIAKSSGGGQWATWGKVVVFCIIVLFGIVAVLRQPLDRTTEALTPFFSGGGTGLLAAMGMTFIALQGFEIIAAVGGEIKEPARTIPRAMFLSLGAALAIYLPLLFVVSAAGVGPGQRIDVVSQSNPGTVMATAVEHFMGPVGYWLVVIAAILATLSALNANILAASRVALAMARDRTLPAVVGGRSRQSGTPIMALYASALAMVTILFMIPNVEAAGAAASLIFLISFALTHVTAILARQRRPDAELPFRMPLYPLVPVVGGIACLALAIYQAFVVPDAGGITLVWLGLGALLYVSLFAGRAETMDAAAEARDPSLAQMRGRSPLVLLPVANPAHAASMVAVANARAPRDVGRVLLLSPVVTPEDGSADERERRLQSAQDALNHALMTSFDSGHTPEALITSCSDPWTEIKRVAEMYHCESMLLGAASAGDVSNESKLEALVSSMGCDVALMRAPDDWHFEHARRVLVPLGGRGAEHDLRARLLGSLTRTGEREFTFLRLMDVGASENEIRDAKREVKRWARDNVRKEAHVVVRRSANAAEEIVEEASGYDLVVVGLARMGRRRAVLGDVARRLANDSPCAAILLSGRPADALRRLFVPEAVESARDAFGEWSSGRRG